MLSSDRHSERELWPDIMRGVLILLVLFHHSAAWTKLLYTPFFMTGFFFISGYFHSESKSFIPFVVAKFKGLVVPALTLGLAYFSASITDGQKLLSLIGRHTLVIYITHSVFFRLVTGERAYSSAT